MGEILFNQWLDAPSLPICSAGTGWQQLWKALLRYKPGYQSEGLVNVDRQALNEARQYGINIHQYPLVQFNVEEFYDKPDGTFDRSQYWRGQEQWVEYLAASFEVVQRRAQELGADLSFKRRDEEWPESVRAFSQWHKSGIVEVFSQVKYGEGLGAWFGERELNTATESWASYHREAQNLANDYYGKVKEHLWAAITGLLE